MERSLSVLLPVHNAQSMVTPVVEEFLDVLPELTRDFDVVVVDDGSTDATIEVADELAARYPQVTAVRQAVPRGRAAAYRTALERSYGEIVLLRDQHCGVPADEVPRLWRAMELYEIVLGCVARGGSPHNGKRTEGEVHGSLRMVWRRAIEPIVEALGDRATLLCVLRERSLSWHEISVRSRTPRAACESVERHFGPASNRGRQPARRQRTRASRCGPRRPSYLGRLKELVSEP